MERAGLVWEMGLGKVLAMMTMMTGKKNLPLTVVGGPAAGIMTHVDAGSLEGGDLPIGTRVRPTAYSYLCIICGGLWCAPFP